MTPTGSWPRISPGLHRVFAAHDVHVRAADRGRGDPDHRLPGSRMGFGTSSRGDAYTCAKLQTPCAGVVLREATRCSSTPDCNGFRQEGVMTLCVPALDDDVFPAGFLCVGVPRSASTPSWSQPRG